MSVNINPTIAHSTVTSFRGKPVDRVATASPGPGSYEFDKK